jgi:nitrile hydratase accessory protein
MSQIDVNAARLCQDALSLAGVNLPLLRDDSPVFAEPWQAQAFAMTLALHDRGLFTWDQWAQALSNCIKAAQGSGDPDTGRTYYQHWLAALEQVAIDARVFSVNQLEVRQANWHQAAQRTPHGLPIELSEAERELPES